MKKYLLLLSLLSTSVMANNGIAIINGGVEKSNTNGIKVDFYNCKVYQHSVDVGGEPLYCDNEDELIMVYKSGNCNAVTHYEKWDTGEMYSTQFRFMCDDFKKAGFSAAGIHMHELS